MRDCMCVGLVFGLTKKEVSGGWRRLHNEELQNVYSSPNITRSVCKVRGLTF
jgi:hypothetical protein